jgi:tRNA threonylcarbamoyladenosine biosynthesis protein TsaE
LGLRAFVAHTCAAIDYLYGMEMTFTLKEIQTIAREFWNKLEGKKVFAFHGQMGTGKTTFIHALCDEKRVIDVVGSPTFAIINEYKSPESSIFHIDLYRLKDAEEAVQAGVEECLYSGNICLVEWPERAAAIFPESTVHVYLEVVDEETRNLRIADN